MTGPTPSPGAPRRAASPRLAVLGLNLLAGVAAAAALTAGHLAGGLAAHGGAAEPPALRTLSGLLAVLAAAALVGQGALGVALRRRLEASEARAGELELKDELTGVGTRRLVLERLTDELGRARRYHRPLSVALLDVDGLSRVNESVGTDGGDAVLRAVAAAVRAQLRRSDLAGRLRDDELLVVLPETDEAGARAIAERLRFAVASARVLHAGISLAATVSVGVATAGAGDAEPEAGADLLLRRADQALFRAKAAGRDQVAAGDSIPSAREIQPPPSSASPS
jgi:diguanylate cyclase (GGDEF)-like protein